MNNVITVRDGDCPCPGRPHAAERVTLYPSLSLPMASAATVAIQTADSTVSAQQAAIMEAYLPAGIVEWTFLDENRRPVPITRDNLELLLPWDKGGMEVVDAADELYSATLMRPLVARMQKLSQPTPTDDSTSPNPPSGFQPPAPPPPSLPDESAGRLYEVPVR